MTQYGWILDVLADLRAFSARNGLVALAEQLDDATLVAASEIAGLSEHAAAEALKGRGEAGPLYRGAAAGENA